MSPSLESASFVNFVTKNQAMNKGMFQEMKPCQDKDEDNFQAICRAVKVLLTGLSEDITREGILETPKRVAKAMLFALRGYRMSASQELGNALFNEESVSLGRDYGNIVIVRNIEFYSTHRADLAPFHGHAHIAYVPKAGQVVGLSKFARITEVFARRLQTPADLASDLAESLQSLIQPQGVAVIIQARYLSHNGTDREMQELRTARLGCLCEPGQWQELMALLDLDPEASSSGSVNDSSSSRSRYSSHHHHYTHHHTHCSMEDTESFRPLAPEPLPSASASSSACPCCSLPSFTLTSPTPERTPCWRVSTRASMVEAMERAVEQILNCISQVPLQQSPPLGAPPGGDPPAGDTAALFVTHMLQSTRGCEVHAPELAWPKLAQLADAEAARENGNAGPVRCLQPLAQFILETRLPVRSLCEHHLLPFHGVAHVAYIPGTSGTFSRPALEEMVAVYAHRMQVQERLTRQVAHAVAAVSLSSTDCTKASGIEMLGSLGADNSEACVSRSSWGVMVVIEASHLCMLARGVQKSTSVTSTRVVLGEFAFNVDLRIKVLKQLNRM